MYEQLFNLSTANMYQIIYYSFLFHNQHSEEGLTIAGDFITRSEWENLKQELLDEVDVKIQDAMMDAGNENPDMDIDEYPEILGPAPPVYSG